MIRWVAAVVRVMPNTPALVDEGMSAISRGSHCDEAHLLEAEELCLAQASALLCFCGDEKKCHRHRIGEALIEKGMKQKEILFR